MQLDQHESCTAKRANVHHGRVCVQVFVCLCVSTELALFCALQRERRPDG